jgi:hypothetical protein
MSNIVTKLKAKTSGVIKGARIVEVVKANFGGTFSVQVACLPAVPDTMKGYYKTWFKQYIIEGLLLQNKHMNEYFSAHSMTEYVICRESGRGFLKYGFYRRIFVNSVGFEIDRSDGDGTDQSVRYINIWTGAVDETCNFGLLSDYVRAKKAWFFSKADLPEIQYYLHAEAYNRYASEWNTWQSLYNFTNKELGLSEVSIYLFINSCL